MGLEVLGGRLVAADLHDAELFPLPDWRASAGGRGIGTGEHTVEVGGAHKGDVHAHVTVVGGTVEAQVDAKGHGGPGGVFGAAVEAYLAAVSRMRVEQDRGGGPCWRAWS